MKTIYLIMPFIIAGMAIGGSIGMDAYEAKQIKETCVKYRRELVFIPILINNELVMVPTYKRECLARK